MNDKCEGIVLRQQEYKDNDIILRVYSKEYGIISFIAKGIKKANSKNASNCNVFCHSTFYFNYRETSSLHLVKTVEKITLFRHLYEDLLKQSIAQIMVEITEKIGNEENLYLFDLLILSLSNLDKTNNNYAALGLFIAKCNEIVGVNPHVEGCVYCGNTSQIASISIVDGGFVCVNCFDVNKHHLMSLQQLKFFRLLHKAEINDFSIIESIIPCTYEDIESILKMFLEYSGVSLKSVVFLDKIRRF